ncbi:hypothetical protein V8B97DRAFT_1742578 [Scleroderma yunnanense]
MVSCTSRCSIVSNLEPWSGSVIWWSVQVILQMWLYALYQCSKKLLVFMIVAFVAEVGPMMWILISRNLVSQEISISFTMAYKYGHTGSCASSSAASAYIWVSCLIFEAALCLFAIYAGIKHSRGRPHQSARFHLMDVLIQGNVIYFLRWIFSS